MARWRPRSVSCVHRSLPSGCADACSRPASARGRGRRRVPSSAQLAPWPIPGSVMPRGFYQQSAGMAVAGVGDPALGADGARVALGGTRPRSAPMDRPDRRPQSPISVANRTRSTSRPRAGTPAGSLPGCRDRGGHLRDRGIQTVLAIQGGQHGVERGLIGQLQAKRGEGVQPQPQFVLAGPCLPAGVDDPLPQQQFRETMPGRSARPPTSPPPPRQRPDPFQGLVVIGDNRRSNTSPVSPSRSTRPPIARAHPIQHSYADTSLGPPHLVALPARTTFLTTTTFTCERPQPTHTTNDPGAAQPSPQGLVSNRKWRSLMPDTMVDAEVLKDAVHLACRAPSLHNSQPWQWVADSVGLTCASIAAGFSTPPTTGREALISCGAVLDHHASRWRQPGGPPTSTDLPTPITSIIWRQSISAQ